jgi:beta-lactamase regulating signal transducer with metallopeptidase domain
MNETVSKLLDDGAGTWLSWMIEMSVHVAVVVAVITIVGWLLRKRSASYLYMLWFIVLVRLVVPPSFAFPTGWGWWLRSSEEAVSRSPLDYHDHAPISDPIVESSLDSKFTVAPKDATSETAAVVAPANDPTTQSLSWGLLLMLGWLGIVAARLGMLVTASLQVRYWVRRARAVEDPALLHLLQQCRQRVGVHHKIDLRNSEACATPLVVGIWRPVILLPTSVIDELEQDELESVLIHELNHVRRWDGLVNAIQTVLGTLYFFHPLVWWANNRIRQLREDACDEFTVATIDRRKPYGTAIVKVAEILGYAAPPLALGVLDGKTPAHRRLRRILDPDLPRANKRSWRSSLAVALIAAILVPAAAKPTPAPIEATAEGQVDSREPAFAESADLPASTNTGRTEINSQQPAESEPSPPAVPLEDLAEVGHRWNPGDQFTYVMRIEVVSGELTEIFTGTTDYEVQDVHHGKATVAFRGRLDTRRQMGAGHILPPNLSRISPYSPYNGLKGSGSVQTHSLIVNARGDVLEYRGDSQLPYSLGNVSQLVMESFPEQRQRNWVVEQIRPVVRSGHGLANSVAAGRTYTTQPLSPSARSSSRLPDRHFPGERESHSRVDITEKTNYEVVSRDETRIVLEKRFRRYLYEPFRENPTWTIQGSGTTTFDLVRGVATHVRLRMRIPPALSDTGKATDVTISCRLANEDLPQESDANSKTEENKS